MNHHRKFSHEELLHAGILTILAVGLYFFGAWIHCEAIATVGFVMGVVLSVTFLIFLLPFLLYLAWCGIAGIISGAIEYFRP